MTTILEVPFLLKLLSESCGGRCSNQIEFITHLFAHFEKSKDGEAFNFSRERMSKWISGAEKVSPKIVKYYTENGETCLSMDICDEILSLMESSFQVAEKIKQCIVEDGSLDEGTKKELLSRADFDDYEDEAGIADFIAKVLFYALKVQNAQRGQKKLGMDEMGRNYVNTLQDPVIFSGDPPAPVEYFVGRKAELEELHTHLLKGSRVYLSGIAGIGKSELVKMYLELYRKSYDKIVFIEYSGSLYKDIAKLEFSSDSIQDTVKKRFENHDRYFKKMRRDCLIVIDNFNTSLESDKYLDAVLRYPCKVLVVTRGAGYGNHHMVLGEMNPDELYELSCTLFPDSGLWKGNLYELFAAVHNHTFAIELATRLMKTGILDPAEVIRRLKEEPVALDSSDRIHSHKDGKYKKDTYHRYITKLFGMANLSADMLMILKNLSFVRDGGINKKSLGEWMSLPDLNDVNLLIELGFIQEKRVRMLYMHALIIEVLYADFTISFSECKSFLGTLTERLYDFGKKDSYMLKLNEIAQNALAVIEIDDAEGYYRVLEAVAYVLSKREDTLEGLREVIRKMNEVRDTYHLTVSADQSMMVFLKARAYKNEKTYVMELRKASELFPEVTVGNLEKWFIIQYEYIANLIESAKFAEALDACKQMKEYFERYRMEYSYEYVMIVGFIIMANRLNAAMDQRTLTDTEYSSNMELLKSGIEEILYKIYDEDTDSEILINLKDGLGELVLERALENRK